jgi:zinc transporter
MMYGSDRAGLVCAYVFSSGGFGTPITADEAAAWLTDQADPSAFVWLHFNLANTASQRWLGQHLDLPRDFHDLLGLSTSTRVEAAGDALLAVLNDVTFFALEASTASTVTIYVDRRMLVERQDDAAEIGRPIARRRQGGRALSIAMRTAGAPPS